MINMRKINGLVATYNDSATTDAEQNSSRNLVCKAIEKELNCKRWLSANMFLSLTTGGAFFDDYKIELINDGNAYDKFINGLSKLGFKYKLETYSMLGNTQRDIIKL